MNPQDQIPVFGKIPLLRHLDGLWSFRRGDVVKMKQPVRDIWEAPLAVTEVDDRGVHVLNVDEGDGTIVPASRLILTARPTLSAQLRLREQEACDVKG